MKSVVIRSTFAAAALSAGLFAVTASASADTFNIQYFEGVTGSADFYNGINVPLGVSNDFVKSQLGPDGLPVFNPNFTSTWGTVLAPDSAYLNSAGEIGWWTPGAGPAGSTIKSDGSGTVSLSSQSITMFAPGTSGVDATYQETAILTGKFSVNGPSNVTFNVGADDMAFVYVDGQLVESLGGIHSDTAAPANTLYYDKAGTHDIEIFYGDRDVVRASLNFSETGTPVTVAPTEVPVLATPVDTPVITDVPTAIAATPEPGTFVLLGTGLLGAAGGLRRRFAR